MAHACSGRRSTWPPATLTYATRRSTASYMPVIPAREATGASIRHMTTHTVSRMRSKASPTRFALWSSRIIDHYDWLVDNLPVPSRPRQYEFSRLNLTYNVLSKRRLIQLVEDGHVRGWDDPRLPTVSGLRRRGVPPAAIRDFAKRIGVTKSRCDGRETSTSTIVRELLNKIALRRMAVLNPLKVVIENYPEGESEELDAVNNPEDDAAGSRKIHFFSRAMDRTRRFHG